MNDWDNHYQPGWCECGDPERVCQDRCKQSNSSADQWEKDNKLIYSYELDYDKWFVVSKTNRWFQFRFFDWRNMEFDFVVFGFRFELEGLPF